MWPFWKKPSRARRWAILRMRKWPKSTPASRPVERKSMKVVFDAGVVFAGAGWRGEAHRCLLAMAHRRVIAYANDETLKELSNLLADRGDRAKHSPATTLSWYNDHVTQGTVGYTTKGGPSPRPSPHSFVVGRGRRGPCAGAGSPGDCSPTYGPLCKRVHPAPRGTQPS